MGCGGNTKEANDTVKKPPHSLPTARPFGSRLLPDPRNKLAPEVLDGFSKLIKSFYFYDTGAYAPKGPARAPGGRLPLTSRPQKNETATAATNGITETAKGGGTVAQDSSATQASANPAMAQSTAPTVGQKLYEPPALANPFQDLIAGEQQRQGEGSSGKGTEVNRGGEVGKGTEVGREAEEGRGTEAERGIGKGTEAGKGTEEGKGTETGKGAEAGIELRKGAEAGIEVRKGAEAGKASWDVGAAGNAVWDAGEEEQRRYSPEPPRPEQLSDDEEAAYEDPGLRAARLEKERLAREEAERRASQMRLEEERIAAQRKGVMTNMQSEAESILSKYK